MQNNTINNTILKWNYLYSILYALPDAKALT